MAMSRARDDREQDKFFEGPSGETVVRVGLIGGFEPPSEFDAITVTYPSSTVEVYAYRDGGVGGTVLMTLTVTYTSGSKNAISSVVRS